MCGVLLGNLMGGFVRAQGPYLAAIEVPRSTILMMLSFTPAGTNSAPTFTGNAGTISAETWTGNSLDNRSAFVKVIFCQKT